ncbi:uncharacterized protein LOC135153984 [Lytechinus pictus]|uniref:uncharacterized protein LOC135153984 n=1 Tax=Lytechinus pictus TaxID=7653 RepID=UPI0030B9E843
MSHDPILFRSYVDTKYPKKSWRHSHQKVATRHGGKFRRSSSGKVRKPPTPKSLRISWNSLDDVVQNEGILRSPLQLPPILPGDITPPMKTDVSDHELDDRLNNNPSTNNSHANDDLSEAIGDGIRAIRKNCQARYGVADESYAESDGRDVDVDPTELSDISYGEEELSEEELKDEDLRDDEMRDVKLKDEELKGEKLRDEELEEGEIVDTDDCREDMEDVNNDGDIDDICRIVDKELHHHDYRSDDILNEITFDILDDLDVDSKYPPNYFRSGFSDRAVRRRKPKRAPRFMNMNTLDPQARSFRPRYTPEEDNEDQRIVKLADCELTDDGRDKEKMDDAVTSGTKFYPSDVRFKKDKRDVKKRVEEPPKASAHANAEPIKDITLEPVPVAVTRSVPMREKGKNNKECGKSKMMGNEGNCDGQEHCLKGGESRTVESEQSLKKHEKEQIRDSEKIENTPSIKPIAKGKARRQVAHKISVVMGRRPAQAIGNQTRSDDGRSVSRSLAAGEEGTGSSSPRRIPQLRPIDTRRYVTSSAYNTAVKVHVQNYENMADAVESDDNVGGGFPDEKVTDELKERKDGVRSKKVDQSRTFQSDSRIRSIDVSQPKYHAMMNQRLAILKESHGNSPVEVARLATVPDRLKDQSKSKETTAGDTGSLSKEREQPRRTERQHSGHRDVELPDVKNKRVAKNVPRAKINPLSKLPDGATHDGDEKGKDVTDTSSGSRQKESSGTKTRPIKETQSESLLNVEAATPLHPEQDDREMGRGPSLSETGREGPPLQPLMQSPPHRFPHPHQHINPNVPPNMRPMPAPGNVHLFQHPSDQHHQFNTTFSAYHHHQMALRTAAMHYYNQQRHLALQRHHPPGLFPPHPYHMNMHPGCRPEWNMPGPGPPR